MVTFVLSGLWHGADWKFIVWGAINGAALVVEKVLMVQRPRSDVPGGENDIPAVSVFVRMGYTFVIICVGWIFFRAASVSSAWLILYKIASLPLTIADPASLVLDQAVRKGIGYLVVFVIIEWGFRRHLHPIVVAKLPVAVRWTVYTIVIWATIKTMLVNAVNPFIYFTF